MQVTELESNGLVKNFKIVVDAAVLSAQTEAELKEAGKSVKIPGFRSGFIPMKVLQQRYGKAVQQDVLKQVINKASGEVISERKLRPALSPKIDIEDYKEGADLTYKMTIESFPEVPEKSFDGITLTRKIFEIEEAKIDEALEKIAKRQPKLTEVKEGAAAKMGQVVQIDFKGMIDGVAFEGGTASDFKLELGSKQFIEGFEEQLVGVKMGDDKIVSVTFPKEYPGAEVAGKEASFAVKVKGIFEPVAPVIDDAFAKQLGFEDLAKLRAAAREQMTNEYNQIVRSQLKKQLFDLLEKDYSFELPPSMLEMEFNTIWDRLQEAQTRGEASFEGKSEAEMKEEYRQIANRRVKLGILLAEIGNRNKLQVTREELTRAVMQQAGQFPGQEKQVMEFYRNHPERLDDLRGPILEEKAVDFILEKVAFKDEKTTVEELVEQGEEGDEPSKKSAKGSKEKASTKKKTGDE
jgi:trigger factor